MKKQLLLAVVIFIAWVFFSKYLNGLLVFVIIFTLLVLTLIDFIIDMKIKFENYRNKKNGIETVYDYNHYEDDEEKKDDSMLKKYYNAMYNPFSKEYHTWGSAFRDKD